MIFSIITMTSGSRVRELAFELSEVIKPKIKTKYSDIDIEISVLISCLNPFERESEVNYDEKENCLYIEIVLSVADYEKLYKAEQRHHLGKVFLEHLERALEMYPIKGLDKDSFINDIINWGKEIPIKMDLGEIKRENWFSDEIDWSVDLDK